MEERPAEAGAIGRLQKARRYDLIGIDVVDGKHGIGRREILEWT
jgi:hypothetical protein